MSQKFHVDGLKWFENKFHFNKHIMENYNDDSDVGYFLQVDVQ